MDNRAIYGLIGAVVLAGLVFGAYQFFGPEKQEGVILYDTVDLAANTGLESGMCAAKLKNTNPYPVNVTYKFAGVEEKMVRAVPDNRTIIEGIGCSSPEAKILDVVKLEK